jgi:hypothetical protein
MSCLDRLAITVKLEEAEVRVLAFTAWKEEATMMPMSEKTIASRDEKEGESRVSME